LLTHWNTEEYEEDQAPSSGSQLGQRIGRVEELLERLMDRIDATSAHAEEVNINVLTPSSSSSIQNENAPILSLFNNSVVSNLDVTLKYSTKYVQFNRDRDDVHLPDTPATSAVTGGSQVSTPFTPISKSKIKLAKVRSLLQSILPSQHDSTLIATSSNGWSLLKKLLFSPMYKGEATAFIHMFSTSFSPDVHPNIVGRLIMSMAVCMQQLGPGFDQSRLEMKGSLRETMERLVSLVATHVTSDDELVGTLDGLECMMLQGFFQLNAGNIRRSWLCFRRALNVAQLMGLHRTSLRSETNSDRMAYDRGRYLWYQIVKCDRYVALILGVPSGTSPSQKFIPDDAQTTLGGTELYVAKLCDISCRILDRNEGEASGAFAATQDIDERLENLSKERPQSWWQIPESIDGELLLVVDESFERLMAQIWHFQLEALLHTPFMLRAASERRYEYSKISCLRASRELLKRWIFLRTAGYSSFNCKIVDFQAFISSVTILLGILNPENLGWTGSQQDMEDRSMVNTVIATLETISYGLEKDTLATQSVDVLKNLMSIDMRNPCSANSMRLTIPHFGTITLRNDRSCAQKAAAALKAHNIENTARSTPQYYNSSNNSNVGSVLQNSDQDGWDVGFGQPPQPPLSAPLTTLQFASNQFVPMDHELSEDWHFGDADIQLFDTLTEAELLGNWSASVAAT
jgi:hypothetical protein